MIRRGEPWFSNVFFHTFQCFSLESYEDAAARLNDNEDVDNEYVDDDNDNDDDDDDYDDDGEPFKVFQFGVLGSYCC